MREAILGVQVYKRDIILRLRYQRYNAPSTSTLNTRGHIKSFSRRSFKRLRHALRNIDINWQAFLTLTYPHNYPADYKQSKKHLNAFLQYLRRKSIKYLWILEYQRRGAPHYHILLSQRINKDDVSERWYRIVNSGDYKHKLAGTQIKAIKTLKQVYAYLSDYLSKLTQKTLPSNILSGRWWGMSRNLLQYEFYYKVGQYQILSRLTRPIRRWYKTYLRKFSIRWKWKCNSFISVLDGVNAFRALYRHFSWDNLNLAER